MNNLMSCVSCVSQGTSVCQVTLIGLTVIFLYASRACYNLVVLALTDIQTINSFDYDWYNVSDQVGAGRLSRSRVFTQTSSRSCLCFCRRTCAPVWATPGTWCSEWFCSSGSCCPRLWWCSSSGCADRRRSGWVERHEEHSSSVDPSLSVICCFQIGSAIPSHVFSNRPYFFDNPRRYDSDDDLAWPSHPVTSSTRWPTDTLWPWPWPWD